MEKQIFDIIYSEAKNNGISIEHLQLKENKLNYSVYYFTSLICNIKISKNSRYLTFDNKYLPLFETKYKISTVNSDQTHIRVHFDTLDNIKDIAESIVTIINSVSVPCTFDICSRYMQCSDEMKCIHPDKQHAKECSYKKKLEKGIVFYGKNRNI